MSRVRSPRQPDGFIKMEIKAAELISSTKSNGTLRGSHWREKYRVRISFVFAILFIWRAQPRSLVFLAVGFVIALLGVFIRQWSAGCVKKMDEIAQTGPYALIRHPLYFGSFLAAFGMIFSATTFSVAVAKPFLDRALFFWSFLWILADSIYLPKIRSEEENLREKFGAAYDDYAARVPQVFPRAFQWKGLDFSTFTWELWKKNKEYGSLIGFGFIYFILFSRFFLR